MTEEIQDQNQELDVETRARLMGHIALEDFKGDPDKWVDAATFVERAEHELPIALGTIKNLERKLDRVERRFSEVSATLESFNKYHQTTLQKEQAKATSEYQRGIDHAQSQMREAAELGDVDAFDAAKAKQDKIIKEASDLEDFKTVKPDDNGKPKIDPEINRAWVEDNLWFLKNFKMNKFAKECGDFLAQAQPELTQKDQLAEIAKMVKEEYPDYFSNSNRTKSDAVGGGDNTAAPAGGRKRGYNDLPGIAKAMCDGFVRDIKGYTKEQYLAQYSGPWKS